jgi:hypothetical protein
MKITIRRLREIVKNSLSGSDPNEAYDHDIINDESFKGKSLCVNKKSKRKIRNWVIDMGLM